MKWKRQVRGARSPGERNRAHWVFGTRDRRGPPGTPAFSGRGTTPESWRRATLPRSAVKKGPASCCPSLTVTGRWPPAHSYRAPDCERLPSLPFLEYSGKSSSLTSRHAQRRHCSPAMPRFVSSLDLRRPADNASSPWTLGEDDFVFVRTSISVLCTFHGTWSYVHLMWLGVVISCRVHVWEYVFRYCYQAPSSKFWHCRTDQSPPRVPSKKKPVRW